MEGLRAVAVLSIVVFHLHGPLLPGGFLGVDVFFVISGFLITRNILGEVEQGRFSLAEFYRRRVKRIVPAMLVVIAVTLAAAEVLFVPEDARQVARSGLFSLVPLANVYFWRYLDTSYFAVSSAQVPLLHLWSLGVEEQFYLIWPLVFVACWRPSRRRVIVAAALAVASLSFLLGDLWYPRDPSFVYYMLPTRAGELLLGIVVALVLFSPTERRMSRVVIRALATTGVMVLAASLVLITEQRPFPGWRAVPPTAATALIILAGHFGGDGVWSRLLASSPMVWVGSLSYAAYLWHWPLLAFFRYGYGEPGPLVDTLVVGVTFGLAWLSYRYVESPFRRSPAALVPTLARYYALPAGALAILALVAMYAERPGGAADTGSYRARLNALRAHTRPAVWFEWVCQRPRMTTRDIQDPRCVLGRGAASEPPVAVLWGDSMAAQYVGMVEEFARGAGFRFRNLEIPSCPPLFVDPTPYIKSKEAEGCRESLALLRPVVEAFPAVIVSSGWLAYESRSKGYLTAAFETFQSLAQRGKLVVVLGAGPYVTGYDRRCREKALRYPLLACPRIEVPLNPRIVEMNGKLRQFAQETPNVRYFDANAYLCPAGVCSAFTPDGQPMYFDDIHLASWASSWVGRQIIEQGGIPDPFQELAARTSASRARPQGPG